MTQDGFQQAAWELLQGNSSEFRSSRGVRSFVALARALVALRRELV